MGKSLLIKALDILQKKHQTKLINSFLDSIEKEGVKDLFLEIVKERYKLTDVNNSLKN